MTGLTEFLNMGGYAVYVWCSYAAAFGILGALTVWTFHRHRILEQTLAQLGSEDIESGAGETDDADS